MSHLERVHVPYYRRPQYLFGGLACLLLLAFCLYPSGGKVAEATSVIVPPAVQPAPPPEPQLQTTHEMTSGIQITDSQHVHIGDVIHRPIERVERVETEVVRHRVIVHEQPEVVYVKSEPIYVREQPKVIYVKAPLVKQVPEHCRITRERHEETLANLDRLFSNQ